MDDKLTIEGILPYLREKSMAAHMLLYDTIDSTNTELKRRAAQGAESGTVVLADAQTSGRGRLGREFYSPAGSGVYFSILLRPEIPAEQLVLFTTAASVVVCHAIETVTGKSPSVKWVNDLYLDGKKVCGILTEKQGDAVVIGVGINCTTVFEGELAKIAGSLSQEGVRCRLAAELVNGFMNIEDSIVGKNFLEEYRRRSLVLGKEITVLQEPDSCYFAEDIGEQGELILRTQSGEKKILSSGEISIRMISADNLEKNGHTVMMRKE